MSDDVELKLVRRWFTEKTTIGEIGAEERKLCFILEDKYRAPGEPKVPGKTCIPCGRYEIRLTWSPRFGRDMPQVCDVPGFTGIRIHPGNFERDTDGCLLPGFDRGQDVVLRSVLATEALEKQLREWWSAGRRTFVTIEVQPEGAAP